MDAGQRRQTELGPSELGLSPHSRILLRRANAATITLPTSTLDSASLFRRHEIELEM